jgi:integrase/recombinase XerD
LEKTGQHSENPASLIKIRGVKRKILYDIISHPELESLYNQYQESSKDIKGGNQNWFKLSLLANQRNKIILGLLIYQGLNTNELASLTENDIKLREGKIFIAGSRRSNERTLKLEAHQIIDIMEYLYNTRPELLLRTGKNSNKLFLSTGTSEEFRSIISKLMKKLHLINSKVTSANQIRASVIIHWLKLYNLRQVQHMAGHRFVSSTEAYKINDLADLQEEILRFHPLG